MKTQKLSTSLFEAVISSYAGYPTRWLASEKMWAIENPGDLDELLAEFESGKQAVSDAKTFLKTYEELRHSVSESAPIAEGATELLPTKIETVFGREFTTIDFRTATLLLYRGNELLRTKYEGKTTFVFSYDNNLREDISKFNNRRLRIEPRAWFDASFQVRDAMRLAKERTRTFAPLSSGLSRCDGEESA